MEQNIYHSPFPPVDIPRNISISQFLLDCNPDDVPPTKGILVDFDDPSNTITYGGLRSNAARCAHALQTELRLREGDTVAIYGQNSANWVLLAQSVMWAGGVFSAINSAATKFELVHYFDISSPAIIATDRALFSTVEAALKMSKFKTRPKIVFLDHVPSSQDEEGPATYLCGLLDRSSGAAKPLDLSTRDSKTVPACMCFSSGTSGKPKGVVLSHYCLVAYCLSLRSTSPTTYHAGIREVWFPPLAHIYGILSGLLIPCFVGSYVVLMKNFDFLQYVERSVDIRATILRLVPSTAIRLVKDPQVRQRDLSCVNHVYCAGASLSSEVVVELQRMLQGTYILGGYGMSEGTISSLRESWSEAKAGSVGKPAAGVTMRVVDDDYRDVSPGEAGECLFRGPTQFSEYKNNRAETDSTFRDGWLCTGDTVRVDEDGFIWITGRKKELIKYKGNQVPPAEIEACLLSHPRVIDAGVCGVYNAELETEIPVGYVSLGSDVAKQDEGRVLDEIKAFVKERVSSYKQLRGGLFRLDDIPKGNTGKLLRRELPAKREELRRSKI